MLGALIGAGSSLLGGLFGKKSEKKAIARQNEYNLPVNQRARWEAAGLNPAVFIAPGSDIQQATGGSNYMGQAIADAGAIMANELSSRTSERQEINALRKQNEDLRKATQKLTLRPATPGIYSQPGFAPVLGASAVGKPDWVNTNLGADENKLAPGREKETDPFKNVSGLFEIENKLTADRPITMYGEGADEVTDLLLQLPIVLPQVAMNWGAKLGEMDTKLKADKLKAEGGYTFKSGGSIFALQPPKKPKAPKKKSTHPLSALGF